MMQKDTQHTRMRRQVMALLKTLEEAKITRTDMEYVLPLFLANIWANMYHDQNLEAVIANMDNLKDSIIKYLENRGWKTCNNKLN